MLHVLVPRLLKNTLQTLSANLLINTQKRKSILGSNAMIIMLQMPYSLEAFSRATASNTAYLLSTLSLKFAFLNNTKTHVWTFKFTARFSLRVNTLVFRPWWSITKHTSLLSRNCQHLILSHSAVFCCTFALPLVAIVLYFLLLPYQSKKYIQYRRVNKSKQLPIFLHDILLTARCFIENAKPFTRPSVLSYLLYRSWLPIQTLSWNPWLLRPMFQIQWHWQPRQYKSHTPIHRVIPPIPLDFHSDIVWRVPPDSRFPLPPQSYKREPVHVFH